MADSRDEGFLTRWARRKQRAAQAPAAKPGAPETPAEPVPSATERTETEAARQEWIDSLPEPEQLGPEDDYAQFLQDGVPDELRQRALRRLWSSNPVFANLDGLNDYDLDYTDAATVVENLKTAFQAGRGMVTKEEREAEAAASAAPGEELAEEATSAETANEPSDALSAEADTAPSEEDSVSMAGEGAPSPRERYRPRSDGQSRVKGAAAQRRWGS
ncbi:DUF3306 domain-containing protein [Rhodovibrio salinarum]|uniref:DUF3306 domain-containing protein n=1 Tax=Rhodovibrio salinarum TaxID=1087 RepID=A0A934QK18_9PROT|nr:DUF3306 domain-containing protein [Rhodovibrio salinarum]MBK1698331.1 DUF3306 domain-containing protein [Rhodovibrio salinarum]